MSPLIPQIAKTALFILAALTLLSFLDKWFWLPELLAHFALQYLWGALALAILFALLKDAAWGGASLAIALIHLTSVLPLYMGRSAGGVAQTPNARALTFVQFNIHGHVNETHDEILAWLARNSDNFDIVQLQEVPPSFGERLKSLAAHYPHQFFEAPGPGRWQVSGLALLSRVKISNIEVRPLSQGRNFYIRGDIDGFNTALYGIHNYNPIRYQNAIERNRQIIEVARAVRDDKTRSLILAGDLNLTPYSSWHETLESMSGLRNTIWGFGAQNSFPSYNFLPAFTRGLLGIPIDHVLVSENVAVRARETGPALGSDHYPIISRLALP